LPWDFLGADVWILLRGNHELFVTGGLGFIGSNFIRYYTKAHPFDSVLILIN